MLKWLSKLYIFRITFALLVCIGIYILLNFIKIFGKNDIKVYEIINGEIANVDRHRGMIYRDEEVASCNNDGYINFYVANKSRVYRGQLIYTISDTEPVKTSDALSDSDVKRIISTMKEHNGTITDNDFSNIYISREDIDRTLSEIALLKELDNTDVDSEINAKEKGYAKTAGIISYILDGYEKNDILDFNVGLVNNYKQIKLLSQKKEVNSTDNIYRLATSTEFDIAFDSDFDYDNENIKKDVNIKFSNENISTSGTIESFYGRDGNKHYKVKICEYPERFIDKRVVEFEIENKRVNGFKVPIKSIVSKNCYRIPKRIIEKNSDTNEYIFYKLTVGGVKEELSCNISKEDETYYYISIDDSLSKLKYGEVLSNKYGDTYSLSEVYTLNGVMNMNKGYAVFKNVEIIDKTNEYAIIKKDVSNGVQLYDRIALIASDIKEGDLIS